MKNLQRIPSIHPFPIFNIILSFGNASLPLPKPIIPKKNRTTKVLHFLNDLYGGRKKISPHLHRHSFATNFLKQGVSLGHLQKLIGYGSRKTTERYTKEIGNIINPLEVIDTKGSGTIPTKKEHIEPPKQRHKRNKNHKGLYS